MPPKKTRPEDKRRREDAKRRRESIQRAIEHARQHPSPTFMLNKTADQGASNTWQALLDREREHRQRMFETLPTLPDDDKQHRVAVREWWDTVSEVLKDIQNVTEGDLPYELFDMLAGHAAYLAVGQIPDSIKHVGGKGRSAPGPSETSDIRWAVTYIHAVREGRVRGLKPPPSWGRKSSPGAVAVAVVRRLYKLRDERTVRKWCRTYEPFPYPEAWTVSSLRNRVADAARQYRLNERTEDARIRTDRERRQKTDFK